MATFCTQNPRGSVKISFQKNILNLNEHITEIVQVFSCLGTQLNDLVRNQISSIPNGHAALKKKIYRRTVHGAVKTLIGNPDYRWR